MVAAHRPESRPGKATTQLEIHASVVSSVLPASSRDSPLLDSQIRCRYQESGAKYFSTRDFTGTNQTMGERFMARPLLEVPAGNRQTCSSVLPRRNPYRFRRGFVFSKPEYWDQLPSLSSESKTRRCHGAFFAPGLSLWIFSWDTLFCLHSKVSYPGPQRSSREGHLHRQRGM